MRSKPAALLCLCLLICACAQPGEDTAPASPPPRRVADAIYLGGDILTMEGGAPQYAEALAVRDGRIVWVGSRSEAQPLQGPATRVVDLNGRALLPGFVDANGDLFATAFAASVANLSPPPDGTASSVTAVTRALYGWSKTEPARRLGWIVGAGLDEAQLRERRAPTADELDEVSRTLPVVALHRGGRTAALNNSARELLHLSRKSSGKGLVSGADFAALRAALPDFDPFEQIDKAQAVYASLGFTTAQESGASRGRLAALAAAADTGKLYLDVDSYADVSSDALDVVSSRYRARGYLNHYRVAGWTLALDGGADAAFDAKVDQALARGEQLWVRCGDAAAFDAYGAALRKASTTRGSGDRRPVAVVGFAARGEQIAAFEALGGIALREAPVSLVEAMRAQSRAPTYATLR
ncbi:MAG TPA: amidohydrolase family protein, partial [Myxococcota bacterium]|nr:amidohydrolase family protein [Myxococcota bacterium]